MTFSHNTFCREKIIRKIGKHALKVNKNLSFRVVSIGN